MAIEREQAILPGGQWEAEAVKGRSLWGDAWLRLKRGDGTLDQLYEHWILGQGAQDREPRWSVIRNVLGWVD